MVDPKEELKEHKERFKDNIRFLINNGNIKDALSFIAEYEKIQTNDIDVVNMKAVIKMMENKLEEAEEILWQGVELDNKNKDLLYNFGYLYEGKGEIQTAVNFYRKLLQQTDDAYERKEISSTILKLKLNENTTEKKFIILSSCSWGVMLQRPHHIARSLSRFGYSVDYVQPSSNATTLDSSVNLANAMDYSRNLVKQIGFINIHTPVSVYHDDRLILNNYKEVVQELIDSSNEEVIIVCYFPSHINIIKQLTGNFKVVYECVDDHSDLEYSYWSSKSDREDELKLLSRADVITTTSSALYLAKSLNSDNVYLSKNAVNTDDFDKNIDYNIPEDISNIPGPRVCYVGAVDRWFDEELFYNLVRTHKDKSFIVIGPVKNGILSKKEENLYILGLKEHKHLKNYLRYMDVGIIPFKDDIDIIVNCDPIKMYEYVMSGLPVVATNMPELALGKGYIKVCNGLDDFNKKLNDAVQLKIDRQEINEFISENTWKVRAKQIIDILEGRSSDYSKVKVTDKLKTNWELLLRDNNNAILLSMYSLIFSNKDITKFLNLAEQAYNQLPILYTLKNYLSSLIQNGNLEKAIDVALNDKNIEDCYKAELAYKANSNNKKDILLSMMYCKKDFSEIDFLLAEDEFTNEIEYANYYFETGEYQKSLDIYSTLSKRSYTVHDSPLAAYNFSELLRIANSKYASYFEERYNYLLDKHLNNSQLRVEELTDVAVKNITILIITRNRAHLLDRCISYFENINDERLHVKIHVLDSSDEKEKNAIREMVANHNSAKVKLYSFYEKITIFKKIADGLKTVKDEFCAICADDDFLDKEGIIDSINILNSDSSVITVKGRSYIFRNKDLSKIYDFPRDSCMNLLNQNPVERLKKLTESWVPHFIYLVFRRESLTKVVNMLTEQKLDERLPGVFVEYLWYFYVPLLGKVKNIDTPLNIRDFSQGSGEHTIPGFFQYIKDGTFNQHYQLFKASLIGSFKECNERSVNLSQSIDNIMKSFLINSWNIKNDFIEEKDGYFNLELLKRGIDNN